MDLTLFLFFQVSKLIENTKFLSGATCTAAGLTAGITYDGFARLPALQAGALPQASGGICCIDDIQDMKDNAQVALQEVLAHQKVTVCKAAIHASVRVKTSVLAAARPKNVAYDIKVPLARNVNLSPTLLTCFDLVFAVVGDVDDAVLAQTVLNQVMGIENELPYSKEDIISYLKKARSIKPIISEEAKTLMVQKFTMWRREASLGTRFQIRE